MGMGKEQKEVNAYALHNSSLPLACWVLESQELKLAPTKEIDRGKRKDSNVRWCIYMMAYNSVRCPSDIWNLFLIND